MRVVGYANQLSVRAGDEITFFLSCENQSHIRPEIVRLRRGGSPAHDSNLREETIQAGLPTVLPGRIQTTTSGSYLRAEVARRVPEGVGLALWFRPTRLDKDRRVLISLGARTDRVELTVSRTGIALIVGRAQVATLDIPLVEQRWTFAAATIDVIGSVHLSLHRPGQPEVATTGSASPPTITGPICIGAGMEQGRPTTPFNGAVARPVVAATAWGETITTALTTGADPLTMLDATTTCVLDLAATPSGKVVPDLGELTDGGDVVNLPTRGIPGPFWTGAETDFRRTPAEFDAVHLHDDDLADAGWDPDLTWKVPSDLPSGVYALKVTAGQAVADVDRIPFIVTPGRDGAQLAPVLVVLPTWTYLAYANWRTYAEFEDERTLLYGERRGVDPRDHWLVNHPEYGRSLYDTHSDGSGVCYSSRLRPVVNLRPDYFTPTTRGFRHFAQDLLLLDWLDSRGEHYAVVTDDEVDHEGVEMLSRHRVVLTGSHPEYCSAAMLDAYLSYTHSGGRLMYLGGNGFYQVTARHPTHPEAIEIRRPRSGITTWVSAPGEEHLSATGEPGGLWRLRGRAPNVLAGVGFTAQGFDHGSGYRRTDASADPSVSWVFDGVTAGVGEVFGDAGPGLGGAAGDELDRADVTLGTPVDVVVLASSVGHSEKITLIREESAPSYAAPPPGIHPNIRADIVLFGHPGGGAVFSVGSIGWSTAMTHRNGVNDVARITANVLDHFRDTSGPILGHSH